MGRWSSPSLLDQADCTATTTAHPDFHIHAVFCTARSRRALADRHDGDGSDEGSGPIKIGIAFGQEWTVANWHGSHYACDFRRDAQLLTRLGFRAQCAGPSPANCLQLVTCVDKVNTAQHLSTRTAAPKSRSHLGTIRKRTCGIPVAHDERRTQTDFAGVNNDSREIVRA